MPATVFFFHLTPFFRVLQDESCLLASSLARRHTLRSPCCPKDLRACSRARGGENSLGQIRHAALSRFPSSLFFVVFFPDVLSSFFLRHPHNLRNQSTQVVSKPFSACTQSLSDTRAPRTVVPSGRRSQLPWSCCLCVSELSEQAGGIASSRPRWCGATSPDLASEGCGLASTRRKIA